MVAAYLKRKINFNDIYKINQQVYNLIDASIKSPDYYGIKQFEAYHVNLLVFGLESSKIEKLFKKF